MISRSRFSQDAQNSWKIEADPWHLWLDSYPGVDIVRIYNENVLVDVENSSFGYELTFKIWTRGTHPADERECEAQEIARK